MEVINTTDLPIRFRAPLRAAAQHVFAAAHQRCRVGAALPDGAEDLGDRGLQPLVGIGDDELDPAQAVASELAEEDRQE